MAEKGAYVVAKPATTAPAFFRPGITNFLGQNPTDNIDVDSYNCWISREGLHSAYKPSEPDYSNDANMVLPFNTSGAYFTGLNGEFGVFRIRSKINYEIIPDPSDTALISMATPTLPRNPRFESILSELLSRLPAGNQQVDNDSGDVWRAIRKTAGFLHSASTFLEPAVAQMGPNYTLAYKIGQKAIKELSTGSSKKKKGKGKGSQPGNRSGPPVPQNRPTNRN